MEGKKYNLGCSWFANQLKNKKPCSHWVSLGQFSHCHETCGICAKQRAALVCEDTKGWKDQSGDGCSWYANKLKEGDDCKTWVGHSSFHDQMIHCKKSCKVCPNGFVVDEVAHKKAMKTDFYINANTKSGSDVVRRCATLKFRVVRPSGRAHAGESLIEHIGDDDGDDADRDTDDRSPLTGADLEKEAYDLEDSMDQGSDDEKESDDENAADGENDDADDDDDDDDDDKKPSSHERNASTERALLKKAEKVSSRTWAKWEAQPAKDVKCNAGRKSSADACKKRLKELNGKRELISKKCQLPPLVPYYGIAPHLFCAGSPGGTHACKKYTKFMKGCFKVLKPLDLEAVSCEACVTLGSNFPSLLASGGTHPEQPPLTHEQEMEMQKWQDEKDAAMKEQQAKERGSVRQFYQASEKELHNGGLPVDPSLFTATENEEDNEEDLEDSSSTAIPWPKQTTVSFEVLYQEIETDEGKATKKRLKTAWKKTAKKTKDCSGNDCTYAVDVPCNSAVGPGNLIGRAATNFNIPVRVVFNPFVPEDEVHMSPKNHTKEALHTYLFRRYGGVWYGGAARRGVMKWDFDQFSPEVLDTAMKLVTMVPVEQRGQAPRVVRWMTNLIPNHVLWGNWNGSYGDGKSPGYWKSSKDIFTGYLKTGVSVKYGQCWVFASVTASIGRALGVGIRVMTNFDSAHGKPPYNKGLDNFYYYDNKMVLRKDPENRESGQWNFHVWNDVWMKRNDLKTVKDADGWQAIDATPQEDSCELEDKKKVCRTMMGPAPLNVIKSMKFETKGGEAGYGHTGGGVSYDSYFVYGEANGAFREWVPIFETWHKCPKTCKANWPGDGVCDADCNVKECDFDMGDCCEKDCKKDVKGVALYKKTQCGTKGYTCKGSAKGWGLRRNDQKFIGKFMSTQAPGNNYRKVLDVTFINYKKTQ